MSGMIDACVMSLNHIGRGFCTYAFAMLLQTVVIVAALSVLDILLRRRVRATLRYWIWMLVFIKLVLPPSLSVPTGAGYWYGRYAPVPPRVQQPIGTAMPGPVVKEPIARIEAPTSRPPAAPAVGEPVKSVVSLSEPLSWQGGAFALWIAGVLAFGVRLVQRLLFVRGLVAEAEPAHDDLIDVLDRCRRRMGIRRKVGLLLSPDAFSPAVCGFFRPMILVPAELVEKLPAHSVEAILTHELAHLKRGDIWMNCAQTLLQIVYFYNPLVWLANAIVRRVREQAVDEMVLVVLGAEAGSYSRTLIDIAEMAFLRASPALRLLGVAESRKSLEGRIRHMVTRPMPKTAKVGLWGSLIVLIMAAVLLPMARAQKSAPPRPDDCSVLLLDDKDPTYKGKDTYDDRLYLLDSKGRIQGAVSGLNVSAGAGGTHVLAVDQRRKTLWVVENVGRRLWHFDLRSGQLLGKIPASKANAAAVDPTTGNVWLMIPKEGFVIGGHVQVVSPSGQTVAEYQVPGYDIVYSHRDNCFWTVGEGICKIDREGNVLGRVADKIPWIAVSVSIDEKTGNAWVVVRDHPDIPGSKPEVWIVNANAEIQNRIDLGDLTPFCVTVDSDSGVVFVGCMGATLRFTTDGKKLPTARQIPAFSVATGGSPEHFFAADVWGLMIVVPGREGQLGAGSPPDEVRSMLGMNRRWVARVPWSGAKLESAPELIDLTAPLAMEEDSDRMLAEHPESAERLRSLGKALLMYANDYDDKFPDALDALRTFFSEPDLKWLKDNVEYVGKGRTTADEPTVALAYDKTVIREGKGTLVAYLDAHVSFESPADLEKLGIISSQAR